jgi:hypothetical protein
VCLCICDDRNPERGPMFQLGTTGKGRNKCTTQCYGDLLVNTGDSETLRSPRRKVQIGVNKFQILNLI